MIKSIRKKLKNTQRLLNNKIKGNKDISYYLYSDYEIKPYQEALKIAIIYGMFSVLLMSRMPELWISRLIKLDPVNFRILNLYKDWMYIALTVILIFSIVLKRLLLFKGAIHKLEAHLENKKKIEKDLHQLAYYDTLTGLPNRTWFEKKCDKLMEENNPFAFVYIDVDNFKNINDTLGHLAGDQYLKHISRILIEYIGASAFAARMGGDEFAIIYTNIATDIDIIERVQKLLLKYRKPWKYENHEFYASVSMGIVRYPDQANNLSLLLRNSDIAMYAVKKNSKDNFCFYSDELQDMNLKQITMINELHKAIRNKEFALLYQPIVDLKTNQLVGVEALVRWIHPEKGMISPMEFIPVAEETELIHDIGRWVMRTALLQKKEWEDLGYPHLKMSINVSGKSLVQKGFINEIHNILKDTNLITSEIQLEITETVLIEKMNASKKILNEIHDIGIKIALDDFGTGYSSLTYLKNLPIDVVKLDSNFVKGVMVNGEDSVIVQSVIKLTHDLELQMVAEGIETDEQCCLLKSNHCDYGQGYLFSKPVSCSTIEGMMQAARKAIAV